MSRVSHAVLDDEGDYFDEDPTVGRGVPEDPVGTTQWAPLQAAPVEAAFLNALRATMAEAAPAEPESVKKKTHGKKA